MVLEFSTKALVNLLERKLWNEKGPKRTSKVLCAWCEKLATMVVAAKPFCQPRKH